MPSCAVPNCTSGYKSNLEKHASFQVPADGERRAAWEKAIGRYDLSTKHYVCDRHFHKSEIKTERLLLCHGQIVGVSPYKCPRLVKDAVPSRNLLVSDEDEVFEFEAKFIPTHTDDTFCNENDLDNTGTIPTILFEKIVYKKDIKMPNQWVKYVVCSEIGQKAVCFSKHTLNLTGGTATVTSLQDFIIKSDLTYCINVVGRSFDQKIIGIQIDKIDKIESIEQILDILSAFKVCSGYETTENFSSAVSQKDNSNVVRHNNCTLLLKNKSRCDKCYNVKRNIELKRKRLIEKGGNYKRRRLCAALSLDVEKKLKQFRQENRLVKQSKDRLEQTVQDLKSHIRAISDKLDKKDSSCGESSQKPPAPKPNSGKLTHPRRLPPNPQQAHVKINVCRVRFTKCFQTLRR